MVRRPGALTSAPGVVTEFAATGPSDGPTLPVGLALVDVRPVRAERSTD